MKRTRPVKILTAKLQLLNTPKQMSYLYIKLKRRTSCSVEKSYFFALYGRRTLFALYGSRTFLLSMDVVLFCSVWKSYFFALYGSRTFLLCMEVVLFCSLWSRTFLLCMEVVLFCSLWKSYFFALYGSRTFLLSLYGSRTFLLPMEVVLFNSLWKSHFHTVYKSMTSMRRKSTTSTDKKMYDWKIKTFLCFYSADTCIN